MRWFFWRLVLLGVVVLTPVRADAAGRRHYYNYKEGTFFYWYEERTTYVPYAIPAMYVPPSLPLVAVEYVDVVPLWWYRCPAPIVIIERERKKEDPPAKKPAEASIAISGKWRDEGINFFATDGTHWQWCDGPPLPNPSNGEWPTTVFAKRLGPNHILIGSSQFGKKE